MHFCAHEPRIHRIQKAKSKIKIGATARRVDLLAKRMARAVHVDLFKGINTFKKRIHADDLMNAFKTGSYGHIMRHIPWEGMTESLSPALDGVTASFEESSHIAIKAIPPNKDLKLRYDAKNPKFTRWMAKRTDKLIVGITGDTNRAVQAVVQRSFTHALDPRQVANQIKSSIGLDPRREKALANYSNQLHTTGKSQRNIDALVNDYGNRLLDQRCMTIARTEVRNAANQGQLMVWKEAEDQGLIQEGSKKVWVVDGNPCDICEPMDGEAVGLDESWILEDGSVCDVPTDSHPNCFCNMEIEFGEGD